MKEQGQALVEFILIMPIILLVFIALIDIGSIFVQKYDLNNTLETAAELYQNEDDKKLKAYIAKEEVNYEVIENADLATIKLKKGIKINAPGLAQVLGKNYTIEAEKTIYKDSDDNE